MLFLDALDATRIAGRWSPDEDAWQLLTPVPGPRIATSAAVGADVPVPQAAPRYSWWTLARNPHAMVVTGMVGTVLVRDALRTAGRALAAGA
jgi:hypothetical protein